MGTKIPPDKIDMDRTRDQQIDTPLNQPTIMIATPMKKYHGIYSEDRATTLGSIEVVCGIVCIIANITNIILPSKVSQLLPFGLISGVMFVIAGSLQIVSGRKKTKAWVNTALVFSILAATFTIPILICSSLGIVFEWYLRFEAGEIGHPPVILAGNILMIVSAVIVAVVGIVSAAFACKLICGKASSQSVVLQQVQYVENPSQPGGQVVVLVPASASTSATPAQ